MSLNVIKLTSKTSCVNMVSGLMSLVTPLYNWNTISQKPSISNTYTFWNELLKKGNVIFLLDCPFIDSYSISDGNPSSTTVKIPIQKHKGCPMQLNQSLSNLDLYQYTYGLWKEAPVRRFSFDPKKMVGEKKFTIFIFFLMRHSLPPFLWGILVILDFELKICSLF